MRFHFIRSRAIEIKHAQNVINIVVSVINIVGNVIWCLLDAFIYFYK